LKHEGNLSAKKITNYHAWKDQKMSNHNILFNTKVSYLVIQIIMFSMDVKITHDGPIFNL
jgi:hypothetical protein